MKLHTAPVESEALPSCIVTPAFGLQTTTSKEIDLKLTVRFGQQEVKVPGGQVCFGLKGGELRLKLENGKMPLEKMKLTTPFEPTIDSQEQHEKGGDQTVKIVLSGGIESKHSYKTTTTIKFQTSQVSTKGTEEEPIWIFEAKTQELVLKGQLSEERLGTIEINAKPCHVQATFEVRKQSDLHLFDSEGLLRAKNLHRNKTALLTREFFLRCLAPKLQPYLSRVEGQL